MTKTVFPINTTEQGAYPFANDGLIPLKTSLMIWVINLQKNTQSVELIIMAITRLIIAAGKRFTTNQETQGGIVCLR